MDRGAQGGQEDREHRADDSEACQADDVDDGTSRRRREHDRPARTRQD